MTVRKLLPATHEMLHRPAEHYTWADYRAGLPEKHEKDLLDTRAAAGDDCVGLAGPQIGIPKRIYIAMEFDGWEPVTDKTYTITNPELTVRSRSFHRIFHGCMSLPDQFWEVTTPDAVEITGFDVQGEPMTMNHSDAGAMADWHEMHHLQGHMIDDPGVRWSGSRSKGVTAETMMQVISRRRSENPGWFNEPPYRVEI